jgi:hypothetical protein
MKRSRLYKVLAAVILLCGSAAVATFLGSFRFNPDQDSDASFIARAQQKSASGIKVNASALGTRESQQYFGENLAKYDIQPVWLSIENGIDEQLVFLPITADPDYYHLTRSLIDSTGAVFPSKPGARPILSRASDSEHPPTSLHHSWLYVWCTRYWR